VRRSEALKNLQEAAGSQETVSTSIDVTACKVEIEQTQQMLQESQKAHDKAIAKTFKQLRNLLSGDAQSQWDCVCCKMHKHDSWAAVNGQVTKGRRLQMWNISSRSSVLTQPKDIGSTFSKWCASPRGPLCNSISCKWEC
jgi:hypothetical protein